MHRSLLRAALTVFCLLATAAAHARIEAADAEKLMRVSGQWEQLASLSQQMKSAFLQGLAAGDKPASAEVQKAAQQAADRSITPERLRASARQLLAQDVRAVHLPELLRWFETPQGRRITQAEVDDSNSDQKDLNQRTQTGMALVQAASPQRQALLARVVEVTRAGQSSADVVISMGVLLPLTVSRFMPEIKAPAEAELRAEMESQRPRLAQAFETLSLAGFAIAYQKLPDEDLAAYVAFLGSSAGDHYSDISVRAFQAAVLAALGGLKP